MTKCILICHDHTANSISVNIKIISSTPFSVLHPLLEDVHGRPLFAKTLSGTTSDGVTTVSIRSYE